MRIIDFFLISVLLIFSLTQIGCASFNRKLKNLLGGGSDVQATSAKPSDGLTKFSESPDLAPHVRRQYKRTTKATLADESALDARAGSLWVMEGQGAYLFSQNIVRLIGDPLAVSLDGDPKDQLQSKVSVIKKLLAKIEEKRRLRERGPASDESDAKDKTKKSDKDKTAAADKNAAGGAAGKEPEGGADLGVKNVPTRIVERTVEGNYRVKGSQPFLIGNHEYKVIVTGIVRAEDFNDEGISATKLLDPKFDIVSARRQEGEM